MNTDWPLSRDLVLVGGGHTHALVLRSWGMNPLAGVRVTLINPGASAPYTGMLPGHIAGHYAREDIDIDLVRLARFAGARIVFDKAAGLDREKKLVLLEGRVPVRYDVASIDIGASAELPDIAGFAEHAHSAKPLGPFAAAWTAFVGGMQTGGARADCVVIGGGVAGIELALGMAHRMRSAGLAGPTATVIESSDEVLTGVSAGARRALLEACDRFGVRILTSVKPVRISADAIELSDGLTILANFVVSAAGARAYPWLAQAGLELTNGFINVGMDLQVPGDPSLFAAGDCAHLVHSPRPKAGVFAVREAPVLLHNLKAALSGQARMRYRPQSDYLKLISTGAKSAVGQKRPVSLSGAWVWTLKDRIDRDFMRRLNDLPAMSRPGPPVQRALDDAESSPSDPLCGGCGSKVGRPSLAAALDGLGPPARGDILKGIGDDSAVLQTGGQLQVLSTDHLRAFVEDPYLLARIAAVHALGDVWAMGAAPQSAVLSLIIPRMSETMQAATTSEVIAAVSAVLRSAGADLVGGHTSMGRELTVGLTVTGLLDGPPIGLTGARPGDVLILTKPIGTGVILAADMRGLARGEEVARALAMMQRPLGAAAKLLSPDAHAMTDVTGFGLAGHLMSMLDASQVAARITLADVPLLAGAERLAGQGVRSSIWRSNATLDARVTRPATAGSDLLYDPQTAGGLLAAVPSARAQAVLAAFAAAGEAAYAIGVIESGNPSITVT